MKIVIIGANGNVGKVILNQALSRNYEVTAVVISAFGPKLGDEGSLLPTGNQ